MDQIKRYWTATSKAFEMILYQPSCLRDQTFFVSSKTHNVPNRKFSMFSVRTDEKVNYKRLETFRPSLFLLFLLHPSARALREPVKNRLRPCHCWLKTKLL